MSLLELYASVVIFVIRSSEICECFFLFIILNEISTLLLIIVHLVIAEKVSILMLSLLLLHSVKASHTALSA